ncbi:hypothetical protein [Oenococcus oeni]|uniref:hypothetical protein n=1 Tax=Oenococcus oeni TaxID=1247 RepID=UPI000A64EB02|nr:hypothetical protein [Oenococcus oeni]
MTLDPDSFVLTDNDTGKALIQGTDYQITETSTGFKIEFLGALKTSAKDYYTLTYKTSFDTNEVPEVCQMVLKDSFYPLEISSCGRSFLLFY